MIFWLTSNGNYSQQGKYEKTHFRGIEYRWSCWWLLGLDWFSTWELGRSTNHKHPRFVDEKKLRNRKVSVPSPKKSLAYLTYLNYCQYNSISDRCFSGNNRKLFFSFDFLFLIFFLLAHYESNWSLELRFKTERK